MQELAGEGRRVVEQNSRENREGGDRGRRRGLLCNFSNEQGVHYKVKFFFQTVAQMKRCPKAKV
jgi:hypothetical protein